MEVLGSLSVAEFELRNKIMQFYGQTVTQSKEITRPDLRCFPVIYLKTWEKDLKPESIRLSVGNRKRHPRVRSGRANPTTTTFVVIFSPNFQCGSNALSRRLNIS
jgi:hypothetical protein